MTAAPLASVLIVSRGVNTEHLELLCRSLLTNNTFIRHVWLWINDAPESDGPVDAVRAQLARLEGSGSRCTLTVRHDNWGFTGAYNRMLRAVAYESPRPTPCLILNPDVVLAEGALEALLQEAVRNPSQVLGLPLERLDKSTLTADGLIDSLGIAWTASGRHFDIGGGLPKDDFRLEPSQTLSGVTGALCFFPNDVLRAMLSCEGEVFDDLFFAYREDAELGLRLIAQGVRIRVLKEPWCGHVRSLRGFERGTSPLVDLLGARNRWLLRYKYGRRRPGVRLPTLARDFLVLLATATVERSSSPGLRDARRLKRYARYKGRRIA